MKTKDLRYVTVRGARYLHIDDVADLLRDLGGGEETDVRRRLEVVATNLVKGSGRIQEAAQTCDL